MATRSLIGKQNPDGSVHAVYCHNDGYIIGGVGEILVNYYATEAKLDLLLDGGGMSSLGKTLESTDFYRGKRGEESVNNDATQYVNTIDFKRGCRDCDADYAYLYKNGTWHFTKRRSDYKEFDIVKKHIKNPAGRKVG